MLISSTTDACLCLKERGNRTEERTSDIAKCYRGSEATDAAAARHQYVTTSRHLRRLYRSQTCTTSAYTEQYRPI